MTSNFSTRIRLAAVATFAALLGAAIYLMDAAQERARAQDHSPIIDVANGDPEMAAAIGKARATLPAFWASYAAPKASEDGFSLKVRFATGGSRGEGLCIRVACSYANA